MAAPEGNKFWVLRSKHGPDRKFKSGEELWQACCEYFEWVEDNPLIEEKVFASKGKILTHNVKKMRAMTITGLCVFLEIDISTWRDWRSKDDLSPVITRVEAIIWEQKLTGAAADLLNHNIIAREIGLIDRRDVSTTIKEVNVIRRRFDGEIDGTDGAD